MHQFLACSQHSRVKDGSGKAAPSRRLNIVILKLCALGDVFTQSTWADLERTA
jgi:hypothetical protein